MLNTVKTLKRYYNVTYFFVIKQIFDDDKNFCLHFRFFVSNGNFSTKHVELLKIRGFLSKFFEF